MAATTAAFSLSNMSADHWSGHHSQTEGQVDHMAENQCGGCGQEEISQPYPQGLLSPQLFDGGESHPVPILLEGLARDSNTTQDMT